MQELYADGPSRPPSNALQALISRLRRALHRAGDDVVSTLPGGYRLDVDQDAIDVFRFRRLVREGRHRLVEDAAAAQTALNEALGLWRGDAFADLDGLAFAVAERVQLDELRTVAFEDRIDADLALQLHAEIIAELEQLVLDWPLRERLWGSLALARYRCGRQAAAVRTFQSARHLLAEEVGLEPGPELRRLEAAVLAQDPVLDAPVTRPSRMRTDDRCRPREL
jgi:DNA-binding SARP family transcriptional activator